MAKELALHKLRRQAGTIDFQVRRVSAWPEFMNQPREVVLPRAAFSRDEQRCRGGRNFWGKFQQPQRCRVFCDPRQSLSGHVRERPPCPPLEMRSSE